MLKRYKYRIYPDAKQMEFLEATSGCARFVWNEFLAANKRFYEHSKKFHFYHDMSALLTEIKTLEGYEFLKEVPKSALQYSIKNLDLSLRNSFKKASGFPRFKKKSYEQSFTLTRGQFQIKKGKLQIANLKIDKKHSLIKIRWSRELPSEASSLTIIKDNLNHYYASFVVECSEPTAQSSPQNDCIGLDLGIESFVTTSGGQKHKAPNYKRLLLKARHLQSRLSRKKKKSKNRERARQNLAKIHKKISRVREDFLNKLVSLLVRENQAISIETLKVKEMLKNKHLARAIALQGWSLFIAKLKSKSEEYRREIFEVGTYVPTSQVCSSCDFRWGKLNLNIRSLECDNCHALHDRDVNAAKNILNEYFKSKQTAGHAAALNNACGAKSST